MSHARRGFAAIALGCLAAMPAAAEPAVVTSKLNLRNGPGAAFAVIAVLPPGTKVVTQKCTEEWCRVKFGRDTGYVNKDYLKVGTDSYASAAPAEETKPTLSGPRIWRWGDSDWRNEHWRRLDWHNRMRR